MKSLCLSLVLLCAASLSAQDQSAEHLDGPAPVGETVIRIDLSALDDAVQEVKATAATGREGTTTPYNRPTPPAITPIHAVQGSGESSPLEGSIVTVQGVVTGDFRTGLRGFYLQEEDTDIDADSTTSEGIFVFGGAAEVAPGDLVTVRAPVEEYFGQTQLDGADAGATITINRRGLALPASVPLRLPRSAAHLEAREGMRVTPHDLVITGTGNLDRFGEVEVTSGERLSQFTECHRPDSAGYQAHLERLADDLLVIDDGRGGTNLLPIRLPDGTTLTGDHGLRAGQTIAVLTGILGYGFDRYRLQPTDYTGVTFSGNPRPTAAPAVGGEIRVVSANVLNYFTTLDSRGAETEAELLRQETKIVAALCALEADIVGLLEIENNGNVALERLVDALNTACDRHYAYVASPDTGNDEITVALIYRSDRLTESGTAAALTTPEDLFFGRGSNRVPLAQTFRVTDPGSSNLDREITVAVNHFKSKGSPCGPGDDDPHGAGNCNGTRTAAARALVDWLATDPTGADEDNVLVVGDLNSYRMEEPIEVFHQAGYVNTKAGKQGGFPCAGGPPSYVFGGQWGSLDYALASPALAAHVTGATAWTVNAPEPDALDYRAGGDLYRPDFYRFSDHDPIVVGLDLSADVTSAASGTSDVSGIQLERLTADTYALTGVTRPGGLFLLTNAAGQMVASGEAVPGAQTPISVAGLPAGAYFVVVRGAGGEAASFKIVIP